MIRDRGNQIFALRHATSVANEQGLIISDPETGCEDYGLSESGKTDIVSKLTGYVETLGERVLVVSSDFLRTKETAKLLASELGVELRLSKRLRERFFGTFEGQANSNYQRVWDRDCKENNTADWNVESLDSVGQRMLSEAAASNESVENQSIVLVSHGDPLQILETELLGLPLSSHRDRKALKPGELRRLVVASQ